MEALKNFLAAPFRAAGAFVKIAGRITLGVIGFVVMGAGGLLIDPVGSLVFGIPVFLVGLLLLVRAIF